MNGKRTQGFTLVELMTALAVMAVLLTLMAPSFDTFVSNQRVKAQAADLFSMLTYARSEAIKTNGDVWVHAPSGWENGWVIATEDPSASGWACDTSAACVRSAPPLNRIVSTGSNTTTLRYARTGRLADAASAEIKLCNDSGGALERTIRVDLSGRPNIALGEACT